MATPRLRDWDPVPGPDGNSSSVIRSILWWHLKFWVLPIVLTTLTYVLALGLAKQYAVDGDLMGVGMVMFVTMFVILVIGYALGLLGIHYGYRYWRGQVGGEEEGKERGFSIADGMREIEKHEGTHKAFVHGVATYAAIPFLVMLGLAWFDPKFVTEYGRGLLLLSFPAVVMVTWLNPGKFIAKLTQFVVIAVMVVILGVVLWKGTNLKVDQYQGQQAASAPVDVKAAARLREKREGHLRSEAANCTNSLATAWEQGKPPSEKEEADCREKQEAVRKLQSANQSAPATTWRWPWQTASGAQSSATASTAAGAVNAAGNTAAATSSQVGKRVEYAPSQVTGAISLGDYAAGNYRIIGEGKRTQRFGSANWEMDAYGRVTAEGGNTYSAPSSAPIAGPNGMVIARSGGKTYKVDTCFRHPGGRIHGDLNVAPGDYVGSGSITIWVEKC